MSTVPASWSALWVWAKRSRPMTSMSALAIPSLAQFNNKHGKRTEANSLRGGRTKQNEEGFEKYFVATSTSLEIYSSHKVIKRGRPENSKI